MPTVFLSHASTDAEFARRLVADLRDHDWDARTYVDIVPPSTPLDSINLDNRIAQAIEHDPFFIPILTPTSLASPWFNKEIEIAINSEASSGTANILPALKEECILPEQLGLRPPCDFTSSYDVGFKSLLEKLLAPVVSLTEPQPVEAQNLLNIQVALKELQQAHHDLYTLSPMKFEELISQLLESHGYKVELSTRTNDGGMDLILVGAEDLRKNPLIIECKRYSQGKRIGIESVKSLLGVGRGTTSRQVLISTTSTLASVPKYNWKSSWHLARSRWDLSMTDYSILLSWLASSPELGSQITKPIDQARERYSELIDKKFITGLSADEQGELTRLEELIDETEAELYNQTIKQLKETRDKLSSALSEQGGAK